MADCVWCEKRDIHAEPPCEWVKANINSLEEDFTSPFPCPSLKEMYDDGDWGVQPIPPEPPAPYPFTLFTSGASGELTVEAYTSDTSESPAVHEYELQDGDDFIIEATFEDFVFDGSEPTTHTETGGAFCTDGKSEIYLYIMGGDIVVNLFDQDTNITVITENDERYTLSWTSLRVDVVGEA